MLWKGNVPVRDYIVRGMRGADKEISVVCYRAITRQKLSKHVLYITACTLMRKDPCQFGLWVGFSPIPFTTKVYFNNPPAQTNQRGWDWEEVLGWYAGGKGPFCCREVEGKNRGQAGCQAGSGTHPGGAQGWAKTVCVSVGGICGAGGKVMGIFGCDLEMWVRLLSPYNPSGQCLLQRLCWCPPWGQSIYLLDLLTRSVPLNM